LSIYRIEYKTLDPLYKRHNKKEVTRTDHIFSTMAIL